MNYLMDQILSQLFKTIFNISSQNHEVVTDNPPIRIYVYKVENIITFKIKIGSYQELLTPETMKLLASTKGNITVDKKWWKYASFINYWGSIIPLQYCQQQLSAKFKSLVYISCK